MLAKTAANEIRTRVRINHRHRLGTEPRRVH